MSSVKKIYTYKKIALNFFFLVLFLALVAFYFIFYKVDVIVKPVKEKINSEFIVRVSENKDMGNKEIEGFVDAVTVEEEKEFQVTGEKKEAKENIGTVFIINKASFDQPLIVKTRVLTPDNILFRLKKSVLVPAGGEVEVEVYPDDKNFIGPLKPTKMTIPGLSKKLQKIIYAENRSDLGGFKKVSVLSQEDINIAKEKLSEDLMKKAQKKIALDQKNKITLSLVGKIPRMKKVNWAEELESRTDKKVGEKTDTFKLFLKKKIVEVNFDENKIIELAEKDVQKIIPDDKELLSLDKDSFNYVCQNFDENNKTAEIKVFYSGEMIIKKDFLDSKREELVGKDIVFAKEYLEDLPAIERVDLKTPFNLLKHIPKNKNKIKIIVKTEK